MGRREHGFVFVFVEALLNWVSKEKAVIGSVRAGVSGRRNWLESAVGVIASEHVQADSEETVSVGMAMDKLAAWLTK